MTERDPLREAVEALFAGGFIDAGWKRVGVNPNDAQWALELEYRLAPVRAALAAQPPAAPLGREAIEKALCCPSGCCCLRSGDDCFVTSKKFTVSKREREQADAIHALLPANVDRASVIEEERKRCLSICETWIGIYQDRDIQFTSAREYAVDAIEDIIDLIQDGHDPALAGAKEGKS
jgi:hypothetical protein